MPLFIRGILVLWVFRISEFSFVPHSIIWLFACQMNNELFLHSLSHDEQDGFLAQGWYRMGQKVFTLDYIYLTEWIRVFWLRFSLLNFEFGKSQRQLMSRNARFQTRICPLELKYEHHKLYEAYHESIDFEASPTASEMLYMTSVEAKNPRNIFDSWMIEVRENDRLIAVGVFDIGRSSIAGIINFFHPDYKKYSLGKYLIMKKIEYAIQAGKDWYYPGYIGFKLPKFDYKLYPGCANAEILDPVEQEWLPYSPEMVESLALSQEKYFVPVSNFTGIEEEIEPEK